MLETIDMNDGACTLMYDMIEQVGLAWYSPPVHDVAHRCPWILEGSGDPEHRVVSQDRTNGVEGAAHTGGRLLSRLLRIWNSSVLQAMSRNARQRYSMMRICHQGNHEKAYSRETRCNSLDDAWERCDQAGTSPVVV